MKIDNGPERAIATGKWSRERGKQLYHSIANEDNRDELGQEGFLIFPDDAFKLWPRASGLNRCKYPHHQVMDGKLVVSIPGLRAAYSRAKQQKVYSGELKAHLDRHFVELGLARRDGDEIVMEDTQLIVESTITDNFDEIEAFVEKSHREASRRFFGKSNSRHLADLRSESKSYREAGEEAEPADQPVDTETEPEVKESRPKQIDRAEAPKNGVKRKELYIAFIEYAKRINPKNTFGSVFDKDAFKVTYPFVPEEMRYFYRLANPLLCILEDEVLFSLADLRKVNTDNPKPDRWLIFAADRSTDPKTQDVYAFNREDKGIYHLDETAIANDETIGQPAGESKIGRIAESFDRYIEHLTGVRVL